MSVKDSPAVIIAFLIAYAIIFAALSAVFGTLLKVTLILVGHGDLIDWRGAFFAGLGYSLFRTLDRVAWKHQETSETPI